jgi:hypothetical protein
MNKLSPELTRQILDPAMHAKLLLRAAELIELGWTRGTAARDTEGQKVRSTAPQATHLNRQWSPPRGAGSPSALVPPRAQQLLVSEPQHGHLRGGSIAQ